MKVRKLVSFILMRSWTMEITNPTRVISNIWVNDTSGVRTNGMNILCRVGASRPPNNHTNWRPSMIQFAGQAVVVGTGSTESARSREKWWWTSASRLLSSCILMYWLMHLNSPGNSHQVWHRGIPVRLNVPQQMSSLGPATTHKYPVSSKLFNRMKASKLDSRRIVNYDRPFDEWPRSLSHLQLSKRLIVTDITILIMCIGCE